jgi:phosphatidylglycerol:prolipoprotein diacylglycerol transferase
LHPILIEIGGFPIHSFGVLVLLGVIGTLSWVKRDAPRVGIDGEDAVSLGVEVFIAGLIGSRILFVWHNWDSMYAELPWYQVFNLRQGGLIWYGGLLAAAPAGFIRARAWNMPVRQVCDVMAGAVLIGLAIGRIGCLTAGDDHGSVNFVTPEVAAAADPETITEVPPWRQGGPYPPVRYAQETWYTLTFRDPNALMADRYKGLPLLPAQPAMCFGAALCLLILFLSRKRLAHVPSGLTALLFTLYPSHRFLVEFMRGDPVRGYVPSDVPILGGLSTSQAISVPIVPVALAAFVYLVWKHRDAEAPEPLPEYLEQHGDPRPLHRRPGGAEAAETKAEGKPDTDPKPEAAEADADPKPEAEASVQAEAAVEPGADGEAPTSEGGAETSA